MRKKKLYLVPRIEVVSLDKDISLVMSTEGTGPVDGGGAEPINGGEAGGNVTTFDTKEDVSSFSEDPFKR